MLRLAFDQSFAQPLRFDPEATADFLAIRIGGDCYALRLTQIAGLFANRRIMPVPGTDAALLGIAGFRGTIVPVYSLAMLVGRSGLPAPRWLVIAAATAPLALAFESFEAQLRVSAAAILPAQPSGEARSCVKEYLRSQAFAGPILDLPAVVDAIAKRRGSPVVTSAPAVTKER